MKCLSDIKVCKLVVTKFRFVMESKLVLVFYYIFCHVLRIVFYFVLTTGGMCDFDLEGRQSSYGISDLG